MLSNISTSLINNDDFNVVSKRTDPDILHNLLAEAIADLDTRGISIMDFSEDVRHQSFLIEQQITEAVNAGNKLEFDRCLMEWQRFFLIGG